MSSQGVFFAAAATVAVSGTFLLLALRLQKSLQFQLHHHPHSSPPILRSCISSTSDEKKKKKKKRVQFAEDVVVVVMRTRRDIEGEREEVRRNYRESSETKKVQRSCRNGGIEQNRGTMPANRVALYNGILRDRVAQRLAYSY